MREYRSNVAIVSQNPTLYQGTIRKNILLGRQSQPSGYFISDEIIVQACKDANIWEFISSLPAGLDTTVGPKAVLLSGGQKQRLAIARALLRDPKILLLDEATSALDNSCEKLVQEALHRAAQGRTTVTVVHRLATAKKMDVILVFHEGRVVEKGTHIELMALGGRYSELVRLQDLNIA